jgi:hypothetical protein
MIRELAKQIADKRLQVSEARQQLVKLEGELSALEALKWGEEWSVLRQTRSLRFAKPSPEPVQDWQGDGEGPFGDVIC